MDWTSAPDRVSVRAAGWTWLDRMIQVITLALFPVGLLMATVLAGPRFPDEFLQRVIVIASFLLGLDLTAEALGSVRKVTLDAEGIRFDYLLHKERGRWADLRPGPEPPVHGMWYLLRNLHNKSRRLPERSHQITLEQARAILSFPACPKWPIPEATLAQIGVRRNAAGPT